MNEPIKSGDDCIVVLGLGRHKSPNIGKRVKVGQSQGEHSVYGRVWRCAGDGLMQLGDAGQYVVTGWADIPAAWLLKDGQKPPSETDVREAALQALADENARLGLLYRIGTAA